MEHTALPLLFLLVKAICDDRVIEEKITNTHFKLLLRIFLKSVSLSN